jgi:hypothetical protein
MDTLSVAAQIALVFLGLLAAAGSIALVVLALQLRRIGQKLETRAAPLLDRSAVVAANLEVISARLRTDVEKVSGSVEALTDRLNEASEHMEDRIQEFNALMEVVQGEAEGVFLETAATMRGIRAGAGALKSGDTRWLRTRDRAGDRGDPAREIPPGPDTAPARPAAGADTAPGTGSEADPSGDAQAPPALPSRERSA